MQDGPPNDCISFFNHDCRESKIKPRIREARQTQEVSRSVLGGDPDAPAVKMEGLELPRRRAMCPQRSERREVSQRGSCSMRPIERND